MRSSSTLRSVYPWLICLIGMLFYCFNYFLRVSPSVMEQALMQNLHITAYQFGTLAAFYYYAYTPMQIPAGILYDRFGARGVQFVACLITLCGVFLFISANNLSTACLGRFLIGLGTAFSYIGVLKLASIWLPANRFATVAGLTTAFGMISAILTGKYLTYFVEQFGYQSALRAAIFMAILLCVFILLFMRNKAEEPTRNATYEKPELGLQHLLKSLFTVFSNRQMWLIGMIGCLFYLPASVFLDLWGIPYLQTVYHLSSHEAAEAISFTFIGWILAGPTIGSLSDKLKRRKSPLMLSAILSTLLLIIIFYVPHLPIGLLYVSLFFVGVFCGAHPLCFALGKENSPANISGTAIAVTNTLIMLGGMIFQPIVGFLLDRHAENISFVNNIPVYSASDYTYALSVIPIGLVLAIILCCFLKETYCELIHPAEKIKISGNKARIILPS